METFVKDAAKYVALFFAIFFGLGLSSGLEQRPRHAQALAYKLATLEQRGNALKIVIRCKDRIKYAIDVETGRASFADPEAEPDPTMTWRPDAVDYRKLIESVSGGVTIREALKLKDEAKGKSTKVVGAILGMLSGFSAGQWLASRVGCNSHELNELLTDPSLGFRRKYGGVLKNKLERELGGHSYIVYLHRWHLLYNPHHGEEPDAEAAPPSAPPAPGPPCPSMEDFHAFAERESNLAYEYSTVDFELLLALRGCLLPAAGHIQRSINAPRSGPYRSGRFGQ